MIQSDFKKNRCFRLRLPGYSTSQAFIVNKVEPTQIIARDVLHPWQIFAIKPENYQHCTLEAYNGST